MEQSAGSATCAVRSVRVGEPKFELKSHSQSNCHAFKLKVELELPPGRAARPPYSYLEPELDVLCAPGENHAENVGKG